MKDIESNLKCITYTDKDGVQHYWHSFLHTWEKSPVRILESFAVTEFESVKQNHPDLKVELIDPPF